jgi:hypothetical protein
VKPAGMIVFLMGISLIGMLGLAEAGSNLYSVTEEAEVRDFYTAVSEYYRIPEREIMVVHEQHVSDEEIPVLLFIARKARVPYAGVLNLRMNGKSWMEITRYYRLDPDIYRFQVKKAARRNYGRGFGFYRNHGESDWKGEQLGDDEIVNLVNLRFMTRRYGYAPERIMRMRYYGRDFVSIHYEISANPDMDRKRENGRAVSHSHSRWLNYGNDRESGQ